MIEKEGSQKPTDGIKKVIYIVAVIVAVIVLGIFIVDKQNAPDKTAQAQPVRVICPENPLHRIEVETPGEERWSELVRIPRECGIEMLGDDLAVTIQTFPDEKPYGPGRYVQNLENTVAVRFRTAKKDWVTIIFCPYETHKKKGGKCR
ncbi:MAG: hypothetical protein Q8R36_05140 [bacterium]|nr:hypothetical protein [bacterium]